MKNLLANIMLVLLAAVMLTGCAHKRFTKEATRYEQSGMYLSAVDKYFAALDRKADYINARIGLMRCATNYAEELKQNIEKNYLSLNDNGVVDNYQLLSTLKAKASLYQVDISIDSRTEGQYFEAKNRYLVSHYTEGIRLAENDNFSEALAEFEKVKSVNPIYEDVNERIKYCKCEPLYRRGEQMMTLKKYRTAYANYTELMNTDASYKDALQRSKEAVWKGVLTVAFSDVYVQKPNRPFVDKIISSVKTKVQVANNPFLQIVELDQTQEIIEQQKIAMANNLDFDAGNIIPVRGLLSCRLSYLNYTVSKVEKTKQKGFIRTQNEDRTFSYKKVYYYEYKQNATLSASFSYSVVSSETGLTLLTGVSSPTTSDNIHFVECPNYGVANLFSGSWENQGSAYNPEKDVINDGFLARTAFAVLKNGRTTLKTRSEMATPLVNQISKEMSTKLLKYNPE